MMHYLSSVTVPLYVSGLLVVHHQEVIMYICNNLYVLYVLVVTYIALIPPDDGILASPKHLEV
jgi:hypothetical protein